MIFPNLFALFQNCMQFLKIKILEDYDPFSFLKKSELKDKRICLNNNVLHFYFINSEKEMEVLNLCLVNMWTLVWDWSV